MNKLLFTLLLTGLLSACGAQPTPDPAAVQKAIEQTLAANWTATFTPAPTGTSAPTWTPTALPTDTPTPLPTATSTLTPTATPDLRLIDADPYDFLLTAADLPVEDLYYPPNTITHDRENIHWGLWLGQAELDANGLVDSWYVSYASDADFSDCTSAHLGSSSAFPQHYRGAAIGQHVRCEHLY